jgi:cytochrome c oxidase cbb3-type subunit 3
MSPRRLSLFPSVAALALGLLSGFSARAADEAKAASEARDAELLAAAKKNSVIKSGKATYVALCQSCHADEKAKGDSPSNLFDTKWYHGGRPSEIEKTIQQGVLDKGMPPWGPVLPPEDVTAVTAFILSLQKSS